MLCMISDPESQQHFFKPVAESRLDALWTLSFFLLGQLEARKVQYI